MIERNGFRLASIIDRPDLHRQLLGDYTGAYSLGVTSNGRRGGVALLLRVEAENPTGFSREVVFEGHKIPVIVQGSFRRPKALGRKRVA